MNDNVLRQTEKLLKLAKKNKSEKIYDILNNIKGSSKYKGDVFEYFLAGLYNGTGWKAVVCGGKDDKGIDILLYHGSRLSQVHAIIQAKNMKTRLSKKGLRHEYANFFGDNFSSTKGSSEKYHCKTFIIISLNGYIENTEQFTHPKKATHQVIHHTWVDVKKLICKYSQRTHSRTVFRVGYKTAQKKRISSKRVRYKKSRLALIFFPIILISAFVFLLREEEYRFINILTDEMIDRLHETKLTRARKQDCQTLNYAFETCPQALVYRYKNTYGNRSLKTGLIVYFCGQGDFKKGKCQAVEKKALYVLTGNR